MTRTNHRDRNPDFKFAPTSRGYKPTDEPVPLWMLAAAGVCWVIVIAAATAFMLPLASHLVRWVLGHG